VGGGYVRKALSDVTVDWMMREATAAIGLQFDRGRISGFAPDPTGTLHGMPGGPLGAALEAATEPRPAPSPASTATTARTTSTPPRTTVRRPPATARLRRWPRRETLRGSLFS
jgi:hypothetical protein